MLCKLEVREFLFCSLKTGTQSTFLKGHGNLVSFLPSPPFLLAFLRTQFQTASTAPAFVALAELGTNGKKAYKNTLSTRNIY